MSASVLDDRTVALLGERMTRIEEGVERISVKLDDVGAPKTAIWIAAGGLAVGVSGLFVSIGLAVGAVVLDAQASQQEVSINLVRAEQAKAIADLRVEVLQLEIDRMKRAKAFGGGS